MPVSINDNDPITYNFLKTFFMLEKVNTLYPRSGNTTPGIVLFDSGSGKTVGNQLEHIDSNDHIQTTDNILSGLNWIDRTQKRVCQITILGYLVEHFPLELIFPKENIPKPPPQSMACFIKVQGNHGRKHWISNITKEDTKSLQLILLGLNYHKYFPTLFHLSNSHNLSKNNVVT